MGAVLQFTGPYQKSTYVPPTREQRRKTPEFRALIAAHARKRHAAKMDRMPAWADLAAINDLYVQAKTLERETGVTHHVDHYYPLQGRTVCGLHVEANLQILEAGANMRKGNKMPDDPECQWTEKKRKTPGVTGRDQKSILARD